jgi:hypothetical protein
VAFGLCGRHGGRISSLVCSHLSDAVWKGTGLITLAVPGVDLVYRYGPLDVDLCPTCAAAHGLSGQSIPVQLADDSTENERADRIYELATPVCPECYADAIREAGSRAG